MKKIRPKRYSQSVRSHHGEVLMELLTETMVPVKGEVIVVDGRQMRVYEVVHHFVHDEHHRVILVEDYR